MKKQGKPRKVLVLDADVHAALKATSQECGMRFQALGNSVLRSWDRGTYFRCPESGMEPSPGVRPLVAEG